MTIAFSNKYSAWSTRYSFEPTCFARTGNTLLSSQEGTGIWKHDSNESRGEFYGTAYPSMLEISSNQDPSAVKIFKSLSIESNGGEWGAEVYTNDEYVDQAERQEGIIESNSFINKEGFKYAEMPLSSVNSTSNIAVVGSSDYPLGSALHYYLSYSLYSLQYSTAGTQAPGNFFYSMSSHVTPLIGVEGSTTSVLPFELEFTSPDTSLLPFSNKTEILANIGGEVTSFNEYLQTNVLSVVLAALPSGSVFSIHALKVDDGLFGGKAIKCQVSSSIPIELADYTESSVTDLSRAVDLAISNFFYDLTTSLVGEVYTDVITPRRLFLKSPSDVNGDSMRGPYARIKLSITTPDPIELHAVNVDYEFSKLDARLTQKA